MKQETFINLLGEVVSIKDSKKKANPLIRAFGKGPQDAKCKTCKHLYGKRYSKVYYKCSLRPDTNGTGTDHKVNWPACGKFEAKH